MTNLQGITSIECENHRKLDPYTYDRSDKCKQEQEQEHTHTHTHARTHTHTHTHTHIRTHTHPAPDRELSDITFKVSKPVEAHLRTQPFCDKR